VGKAKFICVRHWRRFVARQLVVSPAARTEPLPNLRFSVSRFEAAATTRAFPDGIACRFPNSQAHTTREPRAASRSTDVQRCRVAVGVKLATRTSARARSPASSVRGSGRVGVSCAVAGLRAARYAGQAASELRVMRASRGGEREAAAQQRLAGADSAGDLMNPAAVNGHTACRAPHAGPRRKANAVSVAARGRGVQSEMRSGTWVRVHGGRRRRQRHRCSASSRSASRGLRMHDRGLIRITQICWSANAGGEQVAQPGQVGRARTPARVSERVRLHHPADLRRCRRRATRNNVSVSDTVARRPRQRVLAPACQGRVPCCVDADGNDGCSEDDVAVVVDRVARPANAEIERRHLDGRRDDRGTVGRGEGRKCWW